ncbi:uncharacterized protein BO88DRAFT_447916 [Aspergillus vadensis CBS 113365]|uniref:Uncharacterized protein n=1 Tax=Aspergillus vadensis (strain CBS 113365 / IMI 142717 / IBT 24658) TaxID=1448311 RepID=A0A319BN15_ASPVC|nr:hypothetical protein BO88DRAFT_447916 [Aspergillus vadensis CBS 113365]PYH74075.1 hypothetical protein BO88DRAFT_447916 [Aspergillus vadensis CBS 113365]
MVGKRKRDAAVVSRTTKVDEEEKKTTPQTETTDASATDVFRKFFEAQFQPLEVPGGQVTRGDESDEEDSEDEDFEEGSESGSDWDGLSGEEDEAPVEVVEHRDIKSQDLLDKKARKAFMTSKPPSYSEEPKPAKKKAKKEKSDDDEEDAMDADNLKNDLALQRLLKESHLLESANELAPTGKNRIKALDLRMQELGAKASLYKQKMPTAHRRGIKEKAEMKEDRRRREAKENGIILEKPAPKSNPASTKRRERGVGGASIGKFAGGALNLSKRDVAAIQGPRRTTKGKGRGRGRR